MNVRTDFLLVPTEGEIAKERKVELYCNLLLFKFFKQNIPDREIARRVYHKSRTYKEIEAQENGNFICSIWQAAKKGMAMYRTHMNTGFLNK